MTERRRAAQRKASLVAGALLLAACGGQPSDPAGGAGGADGGAGGADSCSPGTVLVEETCVAAGVPECATGLEPDGREGCAPILPSEPCAAGEIARLGQTSCEPLADCGSAPWGDIPVDAGTLYVDAARAPAVGAGTSDDPFSELQSALDAALDGSTVAIAAGAYPEALSVVGKSGVRVWGRCPSLVALGGAPAAAGIVVSLADGTELHSVAVVGNGPGIYVTVSSDVVVDRVWIHDIGDSGFLVSEGSVQITDSLIENASGIGLGVVAADATVERSEVRGTRAFEFGPGRGISVERSFDTNVASSLWLSASLVRGNSETGLAVLGAELDMEASAIIDTSSQPDGRYGIGLAVQSMYGPASATVTGSFVGRSHMFGVSVIDALASLIDTTIDTVELQPSGQDFGDGIMAIQSMPGTLLEVERSRVGGAVRAGIANFSTSVVLTSVALECNTLHLDGEAIGGPFEFDDRGGNACWCDEAAVECKVSSTSLEPPAIDF